MLTPQLPAANSHLYLPPKCFTAYTKPYHRDKPEQMAGVKDTKRDKMCFQIRFDLKQQTGQGKHRGPIKVPISLRSPTPGEMSREHKLHESSDLVYTYSEQKLRPDPQSVTQLS